MKPELKPTPLALIEQGQQFTYRGSPYIRATDEQARRHPARELAIENGALLLGYSISHRGKTPVSFILDGPSGPHIGWIRKGEAA